MQRHAIIIVMKKFKFRSVVQLANMKMSVKSAAIVLASSTLISALLGLFRDRLLNSYYLGTYPTGIDAYTAAFTIQIGRASCRERVFDIV